MENKVISETSNTEMVTIPRAEYEDLKAQNQWLLEQLRVVKSKQFGSSSEKASEEVYGQLSLLFNEAEVYAEASEKAEEPAIEVRSHTRQRKSGKARDILPENAKVVEETHTLSEEERICPECGEVMQPIGTEVQEKIQIIPAQIILHRDIYVTYACQNCKENNISTPILQTPKEPALIPGSYASAEAVAHFGVQKLSMGSPLYRQEQEWNRQGFMISRQMRRNCRFCMRKARTQSPEATCGCTAQAVTPSIPLCCTNMRLDAGKNTRVPSWLDSKGICRQTDTPATTR